MVVSLLWNMELPTTKFTSLDDLLNVMDGEKEGSAGGEKYEERFTHYLGLLSSENPGDRWRGLKSWPGRVMKGLSIP